MEQADFIKRLVELRMIREFPPVIGDRAKLQLYQ